MLTAPPDLGELSAGCDELDGVELLMLLLGPGGPLARRTALVSSFGAESVVLLHMAAVVDPALPVVFLETGKHFPETLAYRDRLVRDLGLRDVRAVRPDRLALLQNDRHGRLFAEDPDLCCHIRKTEPLEDALRGFAAWITGRKRFQGGLRADLPVIETEPSTGRLKLNPLASWSAERLEAYRAAHGLPPHPLIGEGYRSIGCAPCTRPVRPGESPRAGRWSGIDKVECGIHLVRQRDGQAETAMERRAETAAEGEPVEAWPLGPGAAGTRDEILRPALERLAAGRAGTPRWRRPAWPGGRSRRSCPTRACGRCCWPIRRWPPCCRASAAPSATTPGRRASGWIAAVPSGSPRSWRSTRRRWSRRRAGRWS